jgi:predicted nucleic acid-binding protein
VVAEVCFLVQREAGSRAEAAFLASLAEGDFAVVDLEPGDWRRASELVLQYGDYPLGFVDAAVVTVAERLDVVEIATIDRRHFAAVRPRHVAAFTILPQ